MVTKTIRWSGDEECRTEESHHPGRMQHLEGYSLLVTPPSSRFLPSAEMNPLWRSVSIHSQWAICHTEAWQEYRTFKKHWAGRAPRKWCGEAAAGRLPPPTPWCLGHKGVSDIHLRRFTNPSANVPAQWAPMIHMCLKADLTVSS